MFIPKDLYALTRNLSLNSQNPNLVHRAMIQAIKSSIQKINSMCSYDFLRILKGEGVGTNEVEQRIKYIGEYVNEDMKRRIRIQMMRKKINDSYKQ